jgi:hypothetical protein
MTWQSVVIGKSAFSTSIQANVTLGFWCNRRHGTPVREKFF